MDPHSRIHAMTSSIHVDELGEHIRRQEESKGYRIRELVSSTQEKLEKANQVVAKVEELAEPWKVSKTIVGDLLAPAKEIVNLLDAVAEIHPVIKVVAGVAKVVIQMELQRHDNDKQVAVVYLTMSSLLFLLSDLDPIFGDDEHLHSQLQKRLEDIGLTVTDFGNFCEVYYRQKGFIKTLRSGKYKDKLSEYAGQFDEHKTELHALLAAQSAMTIRDVRMDVNKVISLLEARSDKEKKLEALVEGMGGLDAVVKDDKKLDELAKKLDEKIDASMRRNIKAGLDDVLKDNQKVFSLKIDFVKNQLEESVDKSTKTLLNRLDAGPHEFIEDEDIKAVWKDMQSRTSAKTRVFLDAVHGYFQRKFAEHEAQTGQKHADAWTLHFLSKIIFYPAIGDAIDEDSSGFVSVHEVNQFLKSKPAGMNCSTIAWIAFWAVGPYKTDVEHQSRIKIMTSDLEAAHDQVLPQNAKRVKYLAGLTKDLAFVSVYENILAFLGEDEDGDDAYEAMEHLRVTWRNLEMKRIKANLDRVQYRLKGADYVSLVLDGRRLEHYLMTLVYLLLYRHLQIVKLARTQTVSVAEFVDMRDTWDWVFVAFGKRLDILVEIWRQQRLDIENQLKCYSGGLFEDWHERREALEEMQSEATYEEFDEYEYEYDESVEADVEKNEAEQETGDELVAAAPEHDALSVISDAAAGPKHLSAKDLLLFPVPEEPEDDTYLPVDDDSTWEPPAVHKHKVDMELRVRLENVESKLLSIETMLAQLLAAQGAPGVSQPAAAPKNNIPWQPDQHELGAQVVGHEQDRDAGDDNDNDAADPPNDFDPDGDENQQDADGDRQDDEDTYDSSRFYTGDENDGDDEY